MDGTEPSEPELIQPNEQLPRGVAQAAAAGKGLNRYARSNDVKAAIKAFCENPDNFKESGPRTLYDLSNALKINYATLSRNLQLMAARTADPNALEAEKLNPRVRIWHHTNGLWVWCGEKASE
jgi:hypothetical protein